MDDVAILHADLSRVLDEAIDTHRGGDLFAELLDRLGSSPTPRRVDAPRHDVVDRWLSQAVDAAPSPWSALARALERATPLLPWVTTYENLEQSPGLAAFQGDYSFGFLSGPDTRGHQPPVQADDILAGFTLQAPGITYPAHHHAPPEIYGVISGAIDWQVGDTWTRKSPGDVIIHRPHESHAMRSLDEPVLCWAAWPRDPHSHVYMPSLDPPDARMDPIPY